MGEPRVLFSLNGQLWPDDGEYEDRSWEEGSDNNGKQEDEEGKIGKREAVNNNHLWKKMKNSKTQPDQQCNANASIGPPPVPTLDEKVTSPQEKEPSSELGHKVPMKNERILLKIRKIKKRSKKQKRLKGEEEYDYQITDQKKDDKRSSKKKKETEEPPNNNSSNVNSNNNVNLNNHNDCIVVKPQPLILKDFFETVDDSNQVQTTLPNELLVKIFEFVVQDESKAMINLLNLCRVSEDWRRLILSTPKLWRVVDLSDFNKKPSETELVQFSSLLVNTSHLNFTGWDYTLNLSNLAPILETCGKSLTSIVFRGCYTIEGTILDLLSKACPSLEEIDLSQTSSSDRSERPGSKKGRNKIRKVVYPLFPSFQTYLATNGSKLKSINLSENKINGLTHLFTAITKYCHNLRSLDLSNIQSNSSFLLRVDTLQESCPNLQILRLGNIFIQPPKSGNALGFPKLEELSIPCNNSDHGHGEPVISSLTKDAENLKLLDIRGSPRVTASCIIKIPAWNLQHLAIDNCSTIFSTGLEMIVSKWKHSLIELDISHNLHQTGISAALEALSSEKDCPLKVITLRGSSVLFESVEKLLINCKNLRLIDLQSCRALPRGTKRVFVGEEVVKFRNDIINGRYKNFDQ